MYPDIETQVSNSYLEQILTGVVQPPCLIGGWAVYYTLNDNFKKATLREYPYSRDIDLGFHFDPKWTRKEFEESSYAKTVAILEDKMKFESQNYRFVKRHHMDDGRPLTEEQARHIEQHQIFSMYIDMLVDTKDPKRHKIAGFTVLEEPMLKGVFSRNEYVERELFGVKVRIPNSQLLTKIKLMSLPSRPQEDKKLKDLMDICGLLMYSGEAPLDLKRTKSDLTMAKKFTRVFEKTSKDDWKRIAAMLGSTDTIVKRTARQYVV
jgi:hypothetical protein